MPDLWVAWRESIFEPGTFTSADWTAQSATTSLSLAPYSPLKVKHEIFYIYFFMLWTQLKALKNRLNILECVFDFIKIFDHGWKLWLGSQNFRLSEPPLCILKICSPMMDVFRINRILPGCSFWLRGVHDTAEILRNFVVLTMQWAAHLGVF